MRAQCHHQISLPGFSFCLGHQLKWFNCFHSNGIRFHFSCFLLISYILSCQHDHGTEFWLLCRFLSGAQITEVTSTQNVCMTNLLAEIYTNLFVLTEIYTNLFVQCFWVKGRTCLGMSVWVAARCISSAALSGSAVAKGCAFLSSRLRFYLPNITSQLK